MELLIAINLPIVLLFGLTLFFKPNEIIFWVK